MRFSTYSLPLGLMAALTLTSALHAQERQVWIQVEAKPTLPEAMASAEAFGRSFPQTQGFEMASGWFGIALGPYPESMARDNMLSLKAQGLIPADSYLNFGTDYLAQYFSTQPQGFGNQGFGTQGFTDQSFGDQSFGGQDFSQNGQNSFGEPLPLMGQDQPFGMQEPAATPMLPFGVSPVETSGFGESLQEAEAFEASLDMIAKRKIQEALLWSRHYASTIDGALGQGSRQAISQWQMAKGYGGTGILTQSQYQELIAAYESETIAYGFEEVNVTEAGIRARLPLAMVEFDRFEPPFVHYKEKNGSGLRLSLISKSGGQTELGQIYAQVQALSDIPTEGPRELTDMDFAIEGRAPDRLGFAYGLLQEGAIKGWLISTTPANQLRDTRVIEALRQSFTSTPQAAAPSISALPAQEPQGLTEGLEDGGRPHHSASGFYIDPTGSALTHAGLVQNCQKVTLDRLHEAKVVQLGGDLALLKPLRPLAPAAFATLGAAPAVGTAYGAGYSYGERLPAAVLLNGKIDALQGLGGEPDLLQLSMTTMAGDVGGPVLDGSGDLLGMILPSTEGGRQLPQGLAQGLSRAAIAAEISKAGLTLAQGKNSPLAPHHLTQKASAMTVLVSCWQ